MKYLIITLGLIFITLCSQGQIWNEKYGSPLIVLTETDPWLMVIGSDVPTIAIYRYGDIIYKRKLKHRFEYFHNKIDTSELQKLIHSLGISDSLKKMPHISATWSTDQPTNELILNFDSVIVKSVYGNLRKYSKRVPDYYRDKSRENTPLYFLSVYDNLINLTNKSGKKWMPDFVEVMLTNYSHSPEVPAKWPDTWPNLESETTVKRSEDLYSIYLNKDYFNDLIKLIKSLSEKQAVEINGNKFSITYRFPYPNIR